MGYKKLRKKYKTMSPSIGCWLKWAKLKIKGQEKKTDELRNLCATDPAHYPLDTNRNFINFVKDHSHLTNVGLANRVLSITNKRVSAADVLDLVLVTRINLS